jgi:Fic family protein
MLRISDFVYILHRRVKTNPYQADKQMLQPSYQIPTLPPPFELETKAVLRAATLAHRHLAELKGKAATIPNPGILIGTLSLQEAKASSEIENIVTTQDEVFQLGLFPDGAQSPAAKEVARYRDALQLGFRRMQADQGLLTNNTIVDMFAALKGHSGSFRKLPGTVLRNDATGETVYVPPQNFDDILMHMSDLEKFLNDTNCELDPLVQMAIVHHQFESIHPFTDGNGRIGRIINVLHLVKSGLLDSPILYISRYITANKGAYYTELQAVRDTGNWEPWLLYMLHAIAETSGQTLGLVNDIKILMAAYKTRLRNEHAKFYSQDLLNNIFRHPYTRIEYIVDDLKVTRQTAAKYLEQLAQSGMLEKQSAGRNNYYINRPLVDLFSGLSKGGQK